MSAKLGFTAAVLVTALAGCTSVGRPAGDLEGTLPPPPPPLGELAPMTDALQAIYGEWRLLSGPVNAETDRLTIWSPMFAWGSGCTISQGQLRDLGAGRFAVESLSGGMRADCRSVAQLAPFDDGDVMVAQLDENTLRVERDGQRWLFGKVDVAGTYASEDFVRGEWLLADGRGRPYLGDELTRVTFGPEYRVDAPNCDLATNAWFPDRDWQIQIGGSYVRVTEPCRTRMLGDRLARQGTGTVFVAEPVETRLTVRIGGQRATLVPAARFPELAADAETIEPTRWATELAEAALRTDGGERLGFALRAVGLGGEGRPDVENPADPRRLAFADLTAWHHERAAQAGLLPVGNAPPATLAHHLASAPIVVRAVFEGARAVDRGDGLSLDYLYRVVEGWRGGRSIGELVVVRMPAISGKSRSPLITPDAGDEVLLLASRTGYVAGRLVEGQPPSEDRRVVQMTLPLMGIVDGRLVEAIEGANVLGSADFARTDIDDARELARSVDTRMQEIAPPRPTDRWGNETVRRYFITRIGDRVLPDPTRLWIEYDLYADAGGQRGRGGVVAYFDGCTPVGLSREDGRLIASANAVACPGDLPDGSPITEPAVAAVVRWIEENYFPDVICTSACPTDPVYTAPLPSGDVSMRAMIR